MRSLQRVFYIWAIFRSYCVNNRLSESVLENLLYVAYLKMPFNVLESFQSYTVLSKGRKVVVLQIMEPTGRSGRPSFLRRSEDLLI